jgi:UrcA family protein
MTSTRVESHSNRNLRAALAVIAGCLLTTATELASAAPQAAAVPSIVVNYADLDISTEQGARSLYRRIALAAQAVCPSADLRDLARFTDSRACQQQAIARGVQAVSSPLLAALYAEHAKRS